MTVIAYDGKILAADRLASEGDYKAHATKIRLLKDGSLVAGGGQLSLVFEMFHWIESGADPETMPSRQRCRDDWAQIFLLRPGEPLHCFEQSPLPLIHEGPLAAGGNGREFALGAMHFGASALQAVEVASRICRGCGAGVDYAIVSNCAGIPHGKIQRLLFEEPKLVVPKRLRAA
jgi:hypothetical protein